MGKNNNSELPIKSNEDTGSRSVLINVSLQCVVKQLIAHIYIAKSIIKFYYPKGIVYFTVNFRWYIKKLYIFIKVHFKELY